MNCFFTLKNTKEKGSIVSFALVALLLFSSIIVITSLSILFLREITIKEKLNQILRTAEGKVGLWTVDPTTADYQTALNALINEATANNIPGGSGGGGVIESMLLNYGKGTKAWFAFLPPGECAKLDNGKLLCNSHMCSLPSAPTDPESEGAMCYACKGDAYTPSLFPCTAIPEGWHSCPALASSLCAQPSSTDSFLAKVEEFPTEVVAVIKTSLFGGIFNVERKVMVQGYPRVLNQEIVTAQVPTPVCGIWTESTSCPVPPPCGDPTQTYQVPLNWTCSTPALGCRLLSDPSGVCGPPPGGNIDCPYQLCTCPEWAPDSCPTVTCPTGQTQTGTETYNYTLNWTCPGGNCRPPGGTPAQCGSPAPGGTISCTRPVCESPGGGNTCRFAGLIPCPAGWKGWSGHQVECVSPDGVILPNDQCSDCNNVDPSCEIRVCVPGEIAAYYVNGVDCANGTCTSVAANDNGPCYNNLPKNCHLENGTPVVCEGLYHVNVSTCGPYCPGSLYDPSGYNCQWPSPYDPVCTEYRTIFSGPNGVCVSGFSLSSCPP